MLVQVAHPLEHGHGRRGDVVEVGERLRNARQERAHPLGGIRSDRQRWSLGERPGQADDALYLAQGHAGARDDLRGPAARERLARHFTNAAPLDGRRVEQRF